MVDLLGIVGSVTDPSKTRTAVEVCLEAAAAAGADTELLHLAEYDIETIDGRPLTAYEGDTAAALDAILDSDAYVLGTPVYKGTYSGALKNLLDAVPRGMWMADEAPFENAAFGLVATGATPHHYLVIDTQLRPLMGFFGAHAAGGAYLHGGQFDDGPVVSDPDGRDRLETLGRATVELAGTLEASEALASLGPQV
jgi:FMN reductase